MATAIYPGSFDPITNGHLDVAARAARLFDRVILAVARNSSKSGLFELDQRVGLIQQAIADLPGVEVSQFEGLLVNYARSIGAGTVIRGLRAVSDFEYEFQMALMNRQLAPGVETIFLMPRQEYTYLSSRLVKEVAGLGGAIEDFVPVAVADALRRRFPQSDVAGVSSAGDAG